MSLQPSSLLIVAGHAIWYGNDWHGIEASRFPDPAAMKRTISQHVEDGCHLVRDGIYDALAFSGGQSRKELFNRHIATSEAQGMADFAKDDWLPGSEQVILENYARDSFENVLFSLLAFNKRYRTWPTRLGVLSMPHKSIRFMLMATGLKISDFTFHGVGKVDPLEKNCVNEMKNMNLVIDSETQKVKDPLLRTPYFARKRLGRTCPNYDATGTDDEITKRDNEYLQLVGNTYGNHESIDQVTKCDCDGGWGALAWTWQP